MKTVGINLALLLAVVLAAELVFGGWMGGGYGTLVIPRNVDRPFETTNLYGGGIVRFKRDRHGLRGTYEDPARIDILAIGGSTTNEIFIGEGMTWTDTLAKAFSENGRKVTVVNAGVDGQSTIGHLKNFDLWFPRIPGLKPRYVLAYLGINDFAVAATGHLGKQDHMEAPTRKWKQWLINNSAVYGLYRTLKGAWQARRADLIHNQKNYDGTPWTAAATQPDLAGEERRLAPHLEAYAGRLKELAARIRGLGAEAILVTQHKATYRIRDGLVLGKPLPDGRVDIGEYAGLAAFNKTTLAVCREVKAICVDLAGELFFEDGDHYDGLHTTPKGSEKIGRYLEARLRDLLVTPR
ncbi:MAG: GDSL-type esterase/lipase family protein [Magnetospirillum sp. WYHS-4]